ncbi:Ribosomal large subunit pseudouridine synthase D [Giardia muris]|uniref:Ribosomal large subunit pseudouridine synthase D n=1 Tax=Giardia muris TaxID=5742 RepID=A0A4Z1T0Q2_GIAMU|nr:Ribosomal large subunit pseudouridine synthase D [Giardia muris]|eukprot:TNJ26487.1 Ribosomal large subunit pseudouridine synthase D [Giardia muris]
MSELQVCHEVAGLVIAYKPYNTHLDGEFPWTIRNAFIARYGLTPRFVNQLDYPTSGLIVLARDRRSAGRAGREFSQRHVHKVYLALVQGVPDVSQVSEPIGTDPDDPHGFRMRISDLDTGKSALTDITTLQSFQNDAFTLVLLRPTTGRRHQLRLHLASIGCPIIGDLTYGPTISDTPEPQMLLHAWLLHFSRLAELPEVLEAPLTDFLTGLQNVLGTDFDSSAVCSSLHVLKEKFIREHRV